MSRRKESIPSSKDVADGDNVLSKSTLTKNDKKSPSEQLQGANKVVSLSKPPNNEQNSSRKQLRSTDKLVATSASPKQKSSSHERLAGGDVKDSPTTQPEKCQNKGGERSTVLGKQFRGENEIHREDRKRSGKREATATLLSEQCKINKGDDSNA